MPEQESFAETVLNACITEPRRAVEDLKRAACGLTPEEEAAGCEIIDGYVVDANGEVLRLAEPEPFRIDTRDKAEWAMAKIADAEARLLAVGARRRNLLANLERQEKAQARRLAWLHKRFGPDLEAFARAQLEGRREKTYPLDHGRISFRTTKGMSRITDMPRAVAWMRAMGYAQVVRIEASVTVADVTKAVNNVAFDEAEVPDTSAFFEATGPRESVTITAGIKEP